MSKKVALFLTLAVLISVVAAANAVWHSTSEASFPGSNGQIVFSKSEVEHCCETEVWVASADGSDQRRLTFNPGLDWMPAWSPDGGHIAFNSSRDGETGIYLMDSDGDNVTRLTSSLGGPAQPAWSPDGSRVAYSELVSEDFDIYVIDSDGANPINITNTSTQESWPAWSPNGSLIAFEAEGRDGHSGLSLNLEIYVMSPDGSEPTNLTRSPMLQESSPNWSPDGSLIAFTSSEGGGGDEPPGIYVMNSDGSGRTRLAEGSNPVWSPDGKKIAFNQAIFTGGPPCCQILVMDADGGNIELLISAPFTVGIGDWQPLPAQQSPTATSTPGSLPETGGMYSGRTGSQWPVVAVAFGLLLASLGVAIHHRAAMGKIK